MQRYGKLHEDNIVYHFTHDYDHKIELPAKKICADKKARIGYYLSKMKLCVIRYVQNSVLRGCDVQTGAARAWIDSGIMQLGYLAAARCRWITAGF